jgi:large subunit ribosomal protein L21
MYAVIRTGGKQYRVAAGDVVEVEKLEGAVGESITLDDVLLVSNGNAVQVGTPKVDGASVTAKITGQYRGNKIMVFKYRPKKRIRVRRGHRQYITRLQIQSVNA